MEIKINGKPADITLEEEKTVFEVVEGIQQWLLSQTAKDVHYVSGVEIDGKSYGSRSLDEALKFSIKGISSINITTSSWAELYMEALTSLKTGLESFGSMTGEEQKKYRENWDKSVPALFIKDHEKDLYNMILKAVEEKPNEGQSSFSAAGAAAILSERLREIENPISETALLQPLTEEIAKRLEDLPLDMQTGKDSKAAETITLFSSLVEKIFRLVFLFKYFGTDIESIEVSPMNGTENLSFKDFIADFSAALKEMTSAYEKMDTVLVGDLAEYELAPRLRSLAAVLCGVKTGEKS